MDFLIQNPDLDYLSPQMYALGTETDDSDSHFEISFLNQVWGYDKFIDVKPKIVPSLTYHYFYKSAKKIYKEQSGAELDGFVAWRSDFLARKDRNDNGWSDAEEYAPTVDGEPQIYGSAGGHSVGGGSSEYRCGSSWADACFNNQIILCPSGLNSDCSDIPGRNECFAGMTSQCVSGSTGGESNDVGSNDIGSNDVGSNNDGSNDVGSNNDGSNDDGSNGGESTVSSPNRCLKQPIDWSNTAELCRNNQPCWAVDSECSGYPTYKCYKLNCS